MKAILQVGNTFNMPVKVGYADTVAEAKTFPKNYPPASYIEVVESDGLHVVMLRKTVDTPENGEWIEI